MVYCTCNEPRQNKASFRRGRVARGHRDAGQPCETNPISRTGDGDASPPPPSNPPASGRRRLVVQTKPIDPRQAGNTIAKAEALTRPPVTLEMRKRKPIRGVLPATEPGDVRRGSCTNKAN